jgi:hypothetical protein
MSCPAYVVAGCLPCHNSPSQLSTLNFEQSLRYQCYHIQSIGKSLLVCSPSRGPKPDSCYCQTVAGLLMWDGLPNKKKSLSFTVTAGLRQCSHSQVRVPRYDRILPSQAWDSPNFEGQVTVFMSPGNKMAQFRVRADLRPVVYRPWVRLGAQLLEALDKSSFLLLNPLVIAFV